jgi:hypothetical protein
MAFSAIVRTVSSRDFPNRVIPTPTMNTSSMARLQGKPCLSYLVRI